MKTPVHTFKRTALAVAVTLMTAPAWAVPTLQLDIAGGTYNVADQSIFASSNTFSLYAYGFAGDGLPGGQKPIDLSDKFFISMALVPQTMTPGSYGSFVVNGTTVNVTADMTAGGPPLESTGVIDPGDLAKHGVFPTFFAEQGFFFSGIQSAVYNTQDFAGSGPQTGTGMYYEKFDFDVSGLAPGLGIHFDLYNEKLITKCKNQQGCTPLDIDIDQFAPFSHDAAGYVTAPVPEPETYAMLLAGLGLMGLMARRRKNRPF